MKRSQIFFIIHGVPKPQQRPRKGRYGNFYSPSSEHQSSIGEIALVARARAGAPLILGPVCLTINFYGLPKKTDLSNATKLIEDAMNRVVYADDRQIAELHLYRHECAKGEERSEVLVQY